MQKLILSVFLIFLLVPFSQAFSAEITDTPSTLSVSLNESPFVYQDSEGYTVVVGMVENNNSKTPVTNVKIQVNYFDDFDSSPLEPPKIGYTTLEVIPPNGQSPYTIRSKEANPNITQASVSILGFDSSVAKQKWLIVYSSEVLLDTLFRFSGVLQNGDAPSTDTKVHLAFYDNFEPPRILGVSTIELGNIGLNTKVPLELDEKIDSRAVGFLLFAESNVSYSDFVDIQIPPSQIHTKLVIISDVTVEGANGEKLSEFEVGSTVNIKSKTLIQFVADQESHETAYTYYVQIKESGPIPYVEYIGKFDGRFIGTGLENQSIEWIPENKGLFFIETFVWDQNNVPIAEQGPFVLIIVN